jgi:hypothetical protein
MRKNDHCEYMLVQLITRKYVKFVFFNRYYIKITVKSFVLSARYTQLSTTIFQRSLFSKNSVAARKIIQKSGGGGGVPINS